MSQPEPPPTERPRDPATRAAAIAAAIGAAGVAGAAGAAAVAGGTAAARALAGLTRLLLTWRYRRPTVVWAAKTLVRVHVNRGAGTGAPRAAAGPAVRATEDAAATFAGWFLEAATDRLEKAQAAGVDPETAQAREARYLEQHLDAQRRRRAAAARVDAEAAKPGQGRMVTPGTGPRNDDGGTPGDPDGTLEARGRVILGWKAHTDDKVTPECRAADGAWFYADRPPIIGYPGMPHGGTCRCWPVPITAAAAAAGRTVDEAVRQALAGETQHDDRAHPGADGRRTA